MECKVADDGKNKRHVASGEEGDSMTALAAADLASAVFKDRLRS